MTDHKTSPERRGARHDLTRRTRKKAEERAKLRKEMAEGYVRDRRSIRDLAGEHGLSYGLARTLLLEEGVELRDRTRRASKADQ
ncbi:helix-turn-helix domain-containing protein [Streptomyces sp. NPDC001552]|uniref:helix-turn-helix domain-containing protein n=1 Tax=Streptomyces sp. NPDC001552 TaxID=3364587 RepID=UPI0036BB39DF